VSVAASELCSLHRTVLRRAVRSCLHMKRLLGQSSYEMESKRMPNVCVEAVSV
jgi:hypothetical protein